MTSLRTLAISLLVVAHVPELRTNSRIINEAYRIATGDLLGNVAPYHSGLLAEPTPVILAGLRYFMPWTRDAAINAWNGSSIILPDVTRDTLLSVLVSEYGTAFIGDGGNAQYWDVMVWTTGAWHHYLNTGDREFLALAFSATANTLERLERNEFDPADGLFRGPGWSDGVAGYPLEYANAGGESGIHHWPRFNRANVVPRGFGIPMKALSTNCLYYAAYVTAAAMAKELALPARPEFAVRAEQLKQSINRNFWMPGAGHYRYLVGALGPSDNQEALGQAYAILFGIASAEQVDAIFRNPPVQPAGVPAVWPDFPRYQLPDGNSFSRHAGTVWPQIQGMWAHAGATHGNSGILGHELFQLAAHAVRDKHFAELYHPLTGEIYGGMQERAGKGIVAWDSLPRQTWSATAFIRMMLFGVAGLTPAADGLRFRPCLPAGLTKVELRNLKYRDMTLNLTIEGAGCKSGQREIFLPFSTTGRHNVRIVVGE
jgi:glycogen debranching enzyme